MTTQLNRRNWLRSTSLITTGLFLGSTSNIFSRTPSNPGPNMNFWEWEKKKAKPDLYNLKARLLANENPYGPSDKTRLAIMDAVGMGNRYGHGAAGKLIEMIAEKEGVPSDYIMLGPGSSDLLEKTAITSFIKGGNIVSAEPAYMSIIKTATALKADWKPVPLTKDWAHDLPAMEKAIDDKTQLVYVCNPNNPTGTITPGKALWDFCAKVSDIKPIFVDEAYLEFMEPEDKMSMVGLLNEGKNIIISRTFSKVHGMAGLRVGYIVALPTTLEKIRKTFRSNMGMNITALEGAMASIQDTTFIENSAKWNKECRDYVCSELDKMGFEYLPSQTSFVLFPMKMEGQDFLGKMFDLGIGVRAFEIFDQSYCRVSMGTMTEMKLFVDAIKKVLV